MKVKLLALTALSLGLVACGGNGVNFVFSGFDTLTTGDNYANSRYYDVWTFQAHRSRSFTFGMNSPDFYPHLEIEDDFGNLIAQYDHTGSQADTEISAHFQNGEYYHVIATSQYANDLGDYEVLWENDVELIDVNRPATVNRIKLKTQPKAGTKEPRSKPSSFDPTRRRAAASDAPAASQPK